MLVAWSIVRTVRDWLEPTGFAHIVSVFGLALAIFGALLVPVDLYNVASLSDSMTGQLVDQDERQEVVEHAAIIVVLYQVVFLSLCGFLFVLLPCFAFSALFVLALLLALLPCFASSALFVLTLLFPCFASSSLIALSFASL